MPQFMIRICEPDISDIEKRYVNEALEENELSGHGRHVSLFEERFADFIGVKYCLLVPNGTIAFHLILAAIGLEFEDNVFLPSQTISTVAFSVSHLGGRVVSVDVDKDSWTMDPNQLRLTLSHRNYHYGIVVATPIFAGVSPDMEALSNICEEASLILVEDFAEAIGTRYSGRMSGSIGSFGYCSFFANKTLAAGEGGAIVTNEPGMYEQMKYLRNCAYGKDPEMRFLATDAGYNYRPTNLTAAVLLGQLDRKEELFSRRNEINSWYREFLSPEYVWQRVPEKCEPVVWMNAVLVPEALDKGRGALMKYLLDNGIESRPTFPPIGSHPYLRKSLVYPREMVHSLGESVSKDIWARGILLPSGGKHLDKNAVKYICDVANKFLER